MQTETFKFRNMKEHSEVRKYSKTVFEGLENMSPQESRLVGFLEKTKKGYLAHLEVSANQKNFLADPVAESPYVALDLVVAEMKNKLRSTS